MNSHDAAIASLLAGALLANLPFALARLGTALRLAAVAGLYGAWIALTLALQAQAAAPHAMSWQTWAVTAAFFGVLAFPGMGWRYLRKT